MYIYKTNEYIAMEMRVGQDKQSTQMMPDTISKFYVIRSQSEVVVPVVILSLKGTSIKRKQSSVQGGVILISLYLFIHLSNNSDLIRFPNKVTINVYKTFGILNYVHMNAFQIILLFYEKYLSVSIHFVKDCLGISLYYSKQIFVKEAKVIFVCLRRLVKSNSTEKPCSICQWEIHCFLTRLIT